MEKISFEQKIKKLQTQLKDKSEGELEKTRTRDLSQSKGQINVA